MSNTIKLGTLYMDNVKVDMSTSVINQYQSNAILEIKESDINSNYQLEWVQINDGAKQYLISTKNLLTNISYYDLSKQGLIDGVLITLNNTKYILRVPSGGISERIIGNKYSKGTPTDNEWDKYICNERLLTSVPTPNDNDLTGNYTLTTISTSDSNNLLHWYGTSSICKEKSNTNIITLRGNSSVGYIDSCGIYDKSINLIGYRPILEVYNSPPSISGTDMNLGNYATNIMKKYTIYDGDNDLLKVTELIDGVELNVYPNRINNETFTLTLANVWESLTYTDHTIKIIVEDGLGNSYTRTWTFKKVKDTGGYTTTLTRPVLNSYRNSGVLKPINAMVDNAIEFNVVGGDLIYANELQITDNETNIVLYQRKNTTFDFTHTIPRRTLTNGKEYQLRIRTYNSSNQYSVWSNVVLVKALTPADLVITNIIDGQIVSQNPTMVATYSQDQGDSLVSYKYILYKNGSQVAYSPELYDNTLTYQFTNLENKTNYTIELIVKGSSGMETTLNQEFYCMYAQTRLAVVMKAENIPSKGAISIKTYIKQIIGRVISGNDVYYINGDEADLHNSVVRYDSESPFMVNGDWTLEMWSRDLEDEKTMLLNIYGEYGHIELTRWHNMFSVSKYIGGFKIYEKHAYVDGDISITDGLYFYIQHEVSTGLMNFDIKRTNGGVYTWFNKTHETDTSPSSVNVKEGFNSYDEENGFLTNFSHDFKNMLISTTVESQNVKVYIPSIEELTSTDYRCFDYFKLPNSTLKGVITQSAIASNNNTNIELIKGQFYSYFTRSRDSDNEASLMSIDENGNQINAYPYQSDIGIRFVINIPNELVSSIYKDKSGCYTISTNLSNNIYNTQLVSNLNLGDRVVEMNNRYLNEPIRFTIIDKSKVPTAITLLSDIIMIKPYDGKESDNINGNTDWNLSNIKQWLNNDNLLARN